MVWGCFLDGNKATALAAACFATTGFTPYRRRPEREEKPEPKLDDQREHREDKDTRKDDDRKDKKDRKNDERKD